MFTISVAGSVDPIVRQLNDIKNGTGDKALASALNKTVRRAQTQMSRRIREEFNLSAAEVRDKLGVLTASRQSSRYTAALTGNPKGRAARSLNVIRFLEKSTSLAEARRRGKAGTLDQLHFRIKRSGGKQFVTGAFIANKGRTVFVREGKARLPIKPVETIGVPQMFMTKRINQPVRQWIVENFPRLFETDVRYFLGTLR